MRCQLKAFAGILFVVSISCSSSPVQHKDDLLNQPVSSGKDTCDGPDSDINCCFVNMPDNLTNVMKIAGDNDAGERLIITGKVLMKDGKTPIRNAILYAYHTDSKGIYSKAGNETGFQKWHGQFHGWCSTNADGQYEIHTIRPASYPNSSAPAHIHAVLKLPGGETPFYIKDFVFDDDPFVDKEFRSRPQYGEGQMGIVKLEKKDGVWRGVRDLIVTKN